MNFSAWHERAPREAARTLLARVAAMPPSQQRACIASLPDEETLAARFAGADRNAPLGGVPWFAKDLFDVAGEATRAGSSFLAEVRPPPVNDSTLVRRFRAAGAVLAGKSHLHEFAYGLTGENPHHGDCEHPRFPGHTTGGSSSGSAALVAAGVVPLASGTDTGCSVRLPAAFCGLFGFRLTPHDEWIRDAFPLAPSFDTAGWFTGNATDMRTALGALVGWRQSSREPRGVWLDWPDLDADVAEAYRAAAGTYAPPADAGTQRDFQQAFAPAREAYSTIVAHEGLAVHRDWIGPFANRYDPAVRGRLEGALSLTDRQRENAQVTLHCVRLFWTQFFLPWDFLVMPASPCGALTKADCTLANRNRILALTAPASLGGLPVLTVPVPLPSGLSTALQIIVNHPQSPVLPWALGR
jgi:amidase/aspartyl-tRNA(Asn)/glutamyl-tRNA(Gln) amidotransferase subunit A